MEAMSIHGHPQTDFFCDDDNPNVCPYDGARTEIVAVLSNHCVEQCLCCGDEFRFWFE